MVSCFPLDQRLCQGTVSQKLRCSLQKRRLAVAHSRCEFDSAPCRARWRLEQEMANHNPKKTSYNKEGLLLLKPPDSDNPAQCLLLSQWPPSLTASWRGLRHHF